jgi:hypothetical protein
MSAARPSRCSTSPTKTEHLVDEQEPQSPNFPTHVGGMAGGICKFFAAAETVRLRTVLFLYYRQGTAHHNKAPEPLCCHATAQETSPGVGPVPVPWGLIYQPRAVLGTRGAGKGREARFFGNHAGPCRLSPVSGAPPNKSAPSRLGAQVRADRPGIGHLSASLSREIPWSLSRSFYVAVDK